VSDPTPDSERLQKVLAQRGFGSRRVCEQMIVDGRVTVNGGVAELGRRVDVQHDLVAVDGVPVGVRPDFVYYLLHKPYNVITTAKDTHDRVTVVELVPSEPRVHPVGRLDLDSEGLIILTNDGDLTHRLTHPSFGVEKEYLVHVRCGPDGVPDSAVSRLRKGVMLDDGVTAPAKVGQVQPGVLRIVIHEGRHRQVRRMCDAVGHEVNRLVRTRIGPITDSTLVPGAWRHLTAQEVRALAVR
jgi:23S rRNA pseudouridine2605 synthase